MQHCAVTRSAHCRQHSRLPTGKPTFWPVAVAAPQHGRPIAAGMQCGACKAGPQLAGLPAHAPQQAAVCGRNCEVGQAGEARHAGGRAAVTAAHGQLQVPQSEGGGGRVGGAARAAGRRQDVGTPGGTPAAWHARGAAPVSHAARAQAACFPRGPYLLLCTVMVSRELFQEGEALGITPTISVTEGGGAGASLAAAAAAVAAAALSKAAASLGTA